MRMTVYNETGQIATALEGSPQEIIEYLRLSLAIGFMPFQIRDKDDKEDKK